MPRAKRVCAKVGCPATATTSYCPTHQAEAERARGSREQRGYDHAHRELRKQWAPKVARGGILCGKCGNTIQPGTTWHLGHTDDRTTWTGPEHAHCNLSDAGRRSHRPD
jgi:hypothetical protein